MKPTRVKFGTLNLKWLKYPTVSTQLDLVQLIHSMNFDILMIQEGQLTAIEECINHLNEFSIDHWTHITGQTPYFCNSIISKYPIIKQYSMLHGKRNAIIGNIAICDPNNHAQKHLAPHLSIMCTHLDHMNENVRQSQIYNFLHGVKSQYSVYPDILCGDLNALTRSDYTEQEWNDIYNIRNKNKWELPESNLMNCMNLMFDYKDTLESILKRRFYEQKCIGMSYNNFMKDVNDNDLNQLFFEYFKQHWEHTCRFDTRIDYILCSKKLSEYGLWELIDFGFVDTIKTGLTDHKLYWCLLELTA